MLKGEDFFKDKNDEFSGGGGSSFSSSLPERVLMIEKIFKVVLGRKPSSREIAYYKYGIMKEQEIYIKLLKSDEHKKILEDAKKLPNIEDELRDLRISERKIMQSREDLKSEMLSSQNLLDEKNSIIIDLRNSINNPYDLPSQVEKYEEGFDIFNSQRDMLIETKKRKGIGNILREIVNLLFR
ncbi:MAG: hypothetical protein UR61_C0035G0005 [candidate division WS6 bacterium GW2011_GWE1_34_7]|uniref:Uncharacterized protein n=1 Tax=candidate division WS6 bacterium GW2011_GWE1_34_7 TaxID=1619093 RepID=A0A0G0BMW9_9BACT|nr:MAG: hypothetical protein UR61_C0035G0005 [candidate division WS6 bacterium GW2011_GWE1_34_7]